MNFVERINVTVTVFHTIADLLDSRFKGRNVSATHRNEAIQYLQRENPLFAAELIKFSAEGALYFPALFDPETLKHTNPYIWWKSMVTSKQIPEAFGDFCLKIFSCVASSAGIERLLSAFGIVHSKLRNRLGVAKAAKLVTVLKHLNDFPQNHSHRKRKRQNEENSHEDNVVNLDDNSEDDSDCYSDLFHDDLECYDSS